MRFCLTRGVALVWVIGFLGVSCGDADLFDTDKWSDKIEGWEPEVTLQVAHGSFTLWDLINQGQDSVIVKEGNDLLIQYTKDSIYTMPVGDVFSMPQNGEKFQVSIPNIGKVGHITEPHTETLPSLKANLPDISPECTLKNLMLSGKLSCRFPEAYHHYDAQIVFRNITEGGQPVVLNKQLNEVSCEQTLHQALITFQTPHLLEFDFIISIPADSDIPSGGLGELTFQITGLQFERAEGKIQVSPDIVITPGEFNMNVDFFDEIEGKFSFTRPELNLVIHNKGIGVPVALDVTFKNQGMTLALNAGKVLRFDFGENITDEAYITESHGLNASNSNIVDFLSMPPKGDITYQGSVQVNPEGREDNVVYGDGEIIVDAQVKIPFALSADSLIYRDTLTDIDVDQKYADKIQEGVLTIQAENGLPLNLQVPLLTLVDEGGNVLDQLIAAKEEECIKAAEGGNSTKSSIRFDLTHEQAVKLGQTKNILLKAQASTVNAQEAVVKADAILSFKLKVQAKAVITDLDDF